MTYEYTLNDGTYEQQAEQDIQNTINRDIITIMEKTGLTDYSYGFNLLESKVDIDYKAGIKIYITHKSNSLLFTHTIPKTVDGELTRANDFGGRYGNTELSNNMLEIGLYEDIDLMAEQIKAQFLDKLDKALDKIEPFIISRNHQLSREKENIKRLAKRLGCDYTPHDNDYGGVVFREDLDFLRMETDCMNNIQVQVYVNIDDAVKIADFMIRLKKEREEYDEMLARRSKENNDHS